MINTGFSKGLITLNANAENNMKSKPLVLITAFACLLGCQNNEITPVEIKRVLSPTGKFEAVFLECPTNATSDFLYGVVIVERGMRVNEIKQNEFLIAGSSLNKESMHWDSNLSFSIKYRRDGKIYYYQNYWYSTDIIEGKGVEFVELVLYPVR
jgi:hypothetical protein